jgi:hypothetical protein
VGTYGDVLSCQALNATTSQGPDAGRTYSLPKAPGRSDSMPELISGQGEGWNELTGGEILPPITIIMRDNDGVDYSQVWFYLGWWPVLFSQEWWGHI